MDRKIAAVLLDFGGVVLQIDWSRPVSAFNLKGSPNESLLLKGMANWAPYEAYERGEVSTTHFLSEFEKKFELKLSEEAFLEGWNSLIIGPVPDVENLLFDLSEKIPLFALSNTNAGHYDYQMAEHPFLICFEKIFASFEMGVRKPDRDIFMRVSEELGLEPSEILFVDDNPINVEAARATGLKAELSVDSTDNLKRILQRYRILEENE